MKYLLFLALLLMTFSTAAAPKNVFQDWAIQSLADGYGLLTMTDKEHELQLMDMWVEEPRWSKKVPDKEGTTCGHLKMADFDNQVRVHEFFIYQDEDIMIVPSNPTINQQESFYYMCETMPSWGIYFAPPTT